MQGSTLRSNSAIGVITLCCLAIALAVAADAAHSAPPKSVQALVLNQSHVYLGKMKVVLTPHAVRMDCLGEFRFSLVSKAPKWDVTVYRTDDKRYCTQPLKVFCDQGLFSNIVMTQEDTMPPRHARRGTGKLSGFTLQRFWWHRVVFDCLDSKEYAQPEAERILHAAYKVPTAGRIPIKFDRILSGKDWMTNLSEEGIRREFLSTQKISHERVPAAEFDLPLGMTREKSVTRIVVGTNKQLREGGVDALFNLGH